MSCWNNDREGSDLNLSSFNSLRKNESDQCAAMTPLSDVPCIDASVLSFNSNGSLGRLRLDDLKRE
jgi:hypothetical protein